MEVFLEDEYNVNFTQTPSKREELNDLIQCRHLQQIVDSRQSDIKLSRFEDNEI